MGYDVLIILIMSKWFMVKFKLSSRGIISCLWPGLQLVMIGDCSSSKHIETMSYNLNMSGISKLIGNKLPYVTSTSLLLYPYKLGTIPNFQNVWNWCIPHFRRPWDVEPWDSHRNLMGPWVYKTPLWLWIITSVKYLPWISTSYSYYYYYCYYYHYCYCYYYY